MKKLHVFIIFLLLMLSFGCVKSEKVSAQENTTPNQMPTQLSPQDQKKYNNLGWELCNAVGDENLEGALMAIKAGADINFICASEDLSYFPLLIATHHRNIKMVKLLLDNGAKVDFTTGDGYTSLMDAAFSGNLEIAKALIEHGANINATTDIIHSTALILAVEGNQVEMVKYLIKNGANVNIKKNNGKTALKYAEENKNAAIIKALKAAGAGELHL